MSQRNLFINKKNKNYMNTNTNYIFTKKIMFYLRRRKEKL